jgi:5-methylcytosine-specific restriction endonuclease McrA
MTPLPIRALLYRKHKRTIPRGLRKQVLDRDGHRCLACGATEDLVMDHVVPYVVFGPTSFKNLQTLCGSCNGIKRDRTYDFRRPRPLPDWMKRGHELRASREARMEAEVLVSIYDLMRDGREAA